MTRPTAPFYLNQTRVDDLASMLYKLITLLDVAGNHSAAEAAMRMLTTLRRQCCDRSGACDPFPDMPHLPGVFEGGSKKRRRG